MGTHHTKTEMTRTVKKKNPGPELVRSFGTLLTSMENSEKLSTRYTMRTVELVLEPSEYSPEEIQKIREDLRASQGVFAKLLGVSIKTLQAWEQGFNPPPPMARRLLDTIGTNPAPWQKMLKDAAVEV